MHLSKSGKKGTLWQFPRTIIPITCSDGNKIQSHVIKILFPMSLESNGYFQVPNLVQSRLTSDMPFWTAHAQGSTPRFWRETAQDILHI